VVGTARRLQALCALGWSRDALAEQLGCSPQLIERHRTGRLPRLHRDTAARYEAIYQRLQGTPGPSQAARAHATGRGWAPPLLWDDDTLDDPTAHPIREPPEPRRRGLDLDEARFLLSCRLSRHETAARLGVKPESLNRAEHRAALKPQTCATTTHIGDPHDRDGSGMTATTYDDGAPMTAQDVAEAVAEDLGIPLGEAAGMVRGYLDKTSEQVGVPVYNWTLDESDVKAITSSTPATTATVAAVAEATAAVAAASAQADEPAAAAVADEADSDEHVHVEAG
jgi:hypothetical protein